MRQFLSLNILQMFVIFVFASQAFPGAMSRASDSPVLDEIVRGFSPPLHDIADKTEHAVQILYVSIDHADEGPHFTEHRWRVDPERYFYPASTVKLPVALFAMEKLAKMKARGISRGTAMMTDTTQPWQTARHQDPTSRNGMPNIENDVRHLFVVSGNDAYNRLYEFVGLEQIRRRLDELGCLQTRIQHRLAVKRAVDHGRITNPIRFLDKEGALLWQQAEAVAPQSLVKHQEAPALIGKSVFDGGEIIPGPKDFSRHNAFPLEDQYRCLKAIFFPETTSSPLGWLADDRDFTVKMMGLFPEECQGTANTKIRDLPKTYVKSFLNWPNLSVPPSVRCYNKLGEAYGFLIDNAYIVDSANEIAFFLAAVIQVNANQVINDDRYEYDDIGRPFLGALGEAIYRHELERR